MKINPYSPATDIQRARGAKKADSVSGGAQPTNGAPAAATSVALSGTAKFISDMQDEAAALPEVRAEAVTVARDDVANGTLETDETVGAAADGVMASGGL